MGAFPQKIFVDDAVVIDDIPDKNVLRLVDAIRGRAIKDYLLLRAMDISCTKEYGSIGQIEHYLKTDLGQLNSKIEANKLIKMFKAMSPEDAEAALLRIRNDGHNMKLED